MGGHRWSDDAYKTIKTDYKTKSTDDIFTSNKTKKTADTLSPKGLKFRESRDSAANPQSLGIMVWLDVTGSMGRIPENLIRNKMGTLIDTLLTHKVADPAVLFGAIGDHHSDTAPIQIGQFESGTKELNDCLSGVYIEGNGGGQNKESYLLAWYAAARHTSMDCFEKRGKKGYLFTIGDEKTWDNLSADSQKEIFGVSEAENITAEQLLSEAQRMFNVFHIHVNETNYRNDSEVFNHWKALLGERFLVLDDQNNVAEVIASTVAIMEGADKASVLSAFDPSVSKALVNVNTDKNIINSPVIEF